MKKTDFEKKIIKILRGFAADSKTDIKLTDETNLIEDLKLSSVKLISLIVTIEEEFNIVFDNEQLNIDLIGQWKFLEEYLIGKIGVKE